MKIVVCVKQVPDTADIKWTENNTLSREGVESILNPFDEHALEEALKIKDKKYNTHITVITMGPAQAENVLKEALAKGADEAILLSDKKFSGADTLATAKTLASGISEIIKDYDLILCGQFAIDGDTAQTGPAIAANLNLPQITYTNSILEVGDNFIILLRETEYGLEKLRVELPAVICVLNTIKSLRLPKIDGYIKAQNLLIKKISFDKLSLNENDVGLKGSPTYVAKAFQPQKNVKKETKWILENSNQKYIHFLNEIVKNIENKE